MRRLVAGGLACALAGASVLATATLSGAQEEEPGGFVVLDATITPEVAGPGEQVTVTPDQLCTLEGDGPGSLYWFWFLNADVEEPVEGEHFAEGEVPLGGDGGWEVAFPASSLDGEYFFAGFCLPNGFDGYDEEIEACFEDELSEEVTLQAATGKGETPPTTAPPPTTVPAETGFDCLFESYEVLFSVQGGTTPSTVPPGTGTPPPVAPPATPVTEEPPFTG
jgi:hypothetical protein